MEHEVELFLLIMIVEFLISVYKKRKVYELQDTLNSLSCGITNGLVRIFLKWFAVVPYSYIYNNYSIRILDPTSTWSHIIMLLGVDCGYYWTHREMHLINLGWAGHAPHHSSEYLNFATAARQSVVGHFMGSWLYLPLALFFPTKMYLTHYAINLFYQIWLHTELVGKLHPSIELIFNTPSHHRVHHARNPEYLDKNFGGIFIIWDRMFGTFAEEKTTPRYGLTHPLRSWDLIWAQVHHLVYVFEEASKYTKLKNMIAVALAPPGWTISEKTDSWVPPEIPEVDPKEPNFTTKVPKSITIYVFARMMVTIYAYTLVLNGRFPSMQDCAVLTVYVIFSLQSYGMTFNRSRYAFLVEVVRTLSDIPIMVYFSLLSSTFFSFGLLIAYISSFVWLYALRDEFRTFEVPSKKEANTEQRQSAVGVGST